MEPSNEEDRIFTDEEIESLATPAEMGESNDRVTVIHNIYYEQPGEPPTQFSNQASRILPTAGEQPYQRRITLTEVWTNLDLGWFKDTPERVGYISIENLEGRIIKVYPTPEQRKEIARRVVLISNSGEDDRAWQVWPTFSFIGLPSNPAMVKLRCKEGTAKILVTVFPLVQSEL